MSFKIIADSTLKHSFYSSKKIFCESSGDMSSLIFMDDDDDDEFRSTHKGHLHQNGI